MTCTGTTYPINPDAPDEGHDIRHEGPCPVHPTPAEIAEADRQALWAILRTFAEMPYGGMAHFRWPSLAAFKASRRDADPPSLADILANLQRLRDVLARVSISSEKTADELGTIKHNLAGARALADTINRYADLEDAT